jgi:cation diffusion facilitator family transporter
MHKTHKPILAVQDAPAELKKWGQLEGWISVVSNLLLFLLKLWAGILSSSIALIADAWHTLSDSVSSVIVLIGVWASGKPADKDHPFGHGRAELIASVIIGMLLAVIGFDFLLEGIKRLRERDAAEYGTIAIVVTIVSILSKEALAQFAFYTYRKTGAASLRADGWHHRTDSLSSVVVLIGILLGGQLWWIDGLMGMLVAAMIFYAAFEVLREGINPLLGERPDEHLVNEISQLADHTAGREVWMHHIHIHRYGNHVEMTCHIKLPRELSLEESHKVTDHIESAIRREHGITATIHPEPLIRKG